MAATVESSREARRRRITERGPDRLALITGRIQSLPPQAKQSFPSSDSSQHEDITISTPLPIHDSEREAIQHHISNGPVEPLLLNRENIRSTASKAVSLLNVNEELSQVSSSIQDPLFEHQNQRNLFTASQITSAISASENIRMCCSIAVAILVILSYIGFPILSWCVFKSITLFRPFYLLLLTNITIVLARLISATRGHESRMGQTSGGPTFSGNGLFDHLGKAFEIGLLLQNVFGAVFMDFSIYAAVLVCGLSFVQRLGW